MDGVTTTGQASILRSSLAKLPRLDAIRIALGFASFLIYACASLVANQATQNGDWRSYDIERTSMASAISNIVYGAPLAAVYGNLWGTFSIAASPATPLQELLEQAEHKQLATGGLMPYVSDGIGIGQAIFTTVAMRLFGIHAQSIVILFLILVAVATLTFLVRFHDVRSVGIIVVFLALTILFASPVGTHYELISQVPVGGHRYFSLLAVIPALHFFFELIDSIRGSGFVRRNLLTLAIQLLLFMISYFMNIGVTYVFGFLLVPAVYTFVATVGASQRRILFSKILVVLGVIGLSLLTFHALIPKAYSDTGRAQPATFWHHVIIGFGVNPNWPFGNLADQYRGCYPESPEQSLVPGMSDDNGGCAWAAYATQHGMKWDEELYDKNFDIGIREAVLKIIWSYPLQSLVTFVYYKPLRILHTLRTYFEFSISESWSSAHQLRPDGRGLSMTMGLLIIFQTATFLLFTVLNRAYLTLGALRQVYSAFVLGAISTCGLYVAAYSTPITSVDLFFYVLALIGTLTANLAATVARWWSPTRSALTSSA
jgi:hypothetical protein